jgi:hypothetical protein
MNKEKLFYLELETVVNNLNQNIVKLQNQVNVIASGGIISPIGATITPTAI